MKKEPVIEILKRLRGLRAALKNFHYSFREYGEHLIADRFAEGGDDGFDCNAAVDDIQESVMMPFFGRAAEETDIDKYPDEYSAKGPMKNRKAAADAVRELFADLHNAINAMSADMDEGDHDLFGSIDHKIKRAAAFFGMLSEEKEPLE